MSKKLIEQFYEHAGAGRFGEALSLFADDAEIVFHGPASIPLSGRYRGTAEIQRFFGIVGGQIDVEFFAPHQFIDGGATVAVLGRERSKVRATGATFDVPWVQVWTVAGGRITHLADHFDTGSMAPAFAPRS